MPNVNIGARLERERLDRGISQDDAAEMLGISQATFSRWIQGSLPKSEHWTKIGRFLKITRVEVGQIVNEERLADPAVDRMSQLEARFDSLERKVDQVLSALDPAAPPTRRRAR